MSKPRDQDEVDKRERLREVKDHTAEARLLQPVHQHQESGDTGKAEAMRFNDNKPQISRVLGFGTGIDDVAMVMQQGGIKYAEGNWMVGGGNALYTYTDAAARHLKAVILGELYCKELGTKHMAMMVWNGLTALSLTPDLNGPSRNPDFDQQAFIEKFNT